MKLIRTASVAGLLTLLCSVSLIAQSPRHSGVIIVPFVGATTFGSAGFDIKGPTFGVELTWQRGNVLWTPLEISAQFPTQGGYARLASGVALANEPGYVVGVVAGVSRFSANQGFIGFRAGMPLPLPLASVLEARFEAHDRPIEGGSALSFTVRVPFGVR